MKHLEETINQYHIQSEKNLESKKVLLKKKSIGKLSNFNF